MNRLGRALADPTRCRLLVALLDGPAYPAQMAQALGLSRSNVSNHLTCLRGCGLVVAVPQGRQVRYELTDRHLARALTELLEVVLTVDLACPPGMSTALAPGQSGHGDAADERDSHDGRAGHGHARTSTARRSCTPCRSA